MHIDWDAAAIIFDRDTIVAEYDYVNLGAETRERFVNGIIDYLADQVMEPALGGITDVHARASAHRLEPFENLDRLGAVSV
jgi:hypothetical protein